MTEATFDPTTGTLVASPAGIEALRCVARSEGTGAAGREELERAGALQSGAPHRELAPTLEAMATPVCEGTLERGSRRARLWVDARVAVLLMPEPDDRLRLATVPTPFLPAALARANDLGPRPRIEPATRLSFAPDELARLLAERDPAAVATGDDAPALRTLVGELREHWRVEARWAPSPESPGIRVVEVIDTNAGLWLVVPDGPTVELWPTTPTLLFRQLTALLPTSEELAAAA